MSDITSTSTSNFSNTLSTLSSLNPVRLDAGSIFSGRPSGVSVMGYARPNPFTPALIPDYGFSESARDIIVWALSDHPDPIYLAGPTGCGKTSLLEQVFARLNYPVFSVTCHGRMEFADLCGHIGLHGQEMSYDYGPLALAAKYGGLVILNEADMLSPEAATGLNGVLGGSPLCIPENGGEIIPLNPMFRIAATANTNGMGDETGLYQGTLRMNAAWLDRFIMVQAGYPASQVETSLLEKRFPALPPDIAVSMVRYANEVRRLFTDGDDTGPQIELTFSTRTLIRWADLTLRYQPLASQGIQPVAYALDRALGFRACRSTRTMLHELVQRIFVTGNQPE